MVVILEKGTSTTACIVDASHAVVVLCVMNTKTDSSVGITSSRV